MLVKRSVAALALGLFFMPVAADAQWTVANADPPQSTPMRLGPLALAPSIAVTNLGWDSDVFQEGGESAGDFTATTTPQVQGWMRLGQARIRGRGAVAFTYFQTYASERSTDTDFAVRLDWRLARVSGTSPGVGSMPSSVSASRLMIVFVVGKRREQAA